MRLYIFCGDIKFRKFLGGPFNICYIYVAVYIIYVKYNYLFYTCLCVCVCM